MMTARPPKPRPAGHTRPRLRMVAWIVIPLTLLAAGILAVLFWLRIPQTAFAPKPTQPPAAAAGEGGLLYSANFDDPAAAGDWQTFDDGIIAARVDGGRLVVSVNDVSDNAAWSGVGLSFTDFVLDLEATKLDGPDDNGILVIFRLVDRSNYYRFDISSDGFYSLSKVRDGVSRVVSEFHVSPAIQQGGATNRIRLIAQGDSFRFFVNDTPLQLCASPDPSVSPLWESPQSPDSGCLGGQVSDVWRDADLPQGRLGLGAQAYSGFDGVNDTPALAVIAFDNLTIRTPESAGVAP